MSENSFITLKNLNSFYQETGFHGYQYKGSVATIADLPTAAESLVGKVYTVTEKAAEYVCLPKDSSYEWRVIGSITLDGMDITPGGSPASDPKGSLPIASKAVNIGLASLAAAMDDTKADDIELTTDSEGSYLQLKASGHTIGNKVGPIAGGSSESVVDVKVDGTSVVDEDKVANINLSGKANASDLTSHTSNESNPHKVTASQIGAATSDHNHDAVYSNINHTHNYLPLSGGTLTGKVKVTDTTDAVTVSGDTVTPIEGSIYTDGGITAKKSIYAYDKIYNAVWNDIVDCIEVDCDLEYGRVYCFDGKHYNKSTLRCQKGVIGIHSDTAGMIVGGKNKPNELHCAVCGFVLAYVDKEYESGTPLTCGPEGELTEMMMSEKTGYPERMVAVYWKPENEKEWNGVEVNGRHWVKIK